MEDVKKRRLHRKFFIPAELVEHSAFLDKGSGIIDVENLTFCDRLKAWLRDGRLE